jgi:hypothetical protein
MSERPAKPQRIDGSRVSSLQDGHDAAFELPFARQPVLLLNLVGVVLVLGLSGGYDVARLNGSLQFAEWSFLALTALKLALAAYCLWTLAWHCFGIEKIIAHRATLQHFESLFFVRKQRNYSPHIVRNFRWADGDSGYINVKYVPPLPKIEFEYGAKSVRIFRGIDATGYDAISNSLRKVYGWVDIQ